MDQITHAISSDESFLLLAIGQLLTALRIFLMVMDASDFQPDIFDTSAG
jgi:hypothetical protein